MPTIDIKGKAYVTVDSRVEAFRQLFPEGTIATEIVSDDGNRCVFKATVSDGNGHVLATGHAFEIMSASYINKTSYMENCETSAVGRALGFLGIGSNGSIASADEVQAAISQQTGTTSGKAKKAPQNAPESPRRDPWARVNELKAEAVALGIKEEGVNAGCDSVLHGKRKGITADDITAVERYLAGIIANKKSLMEGEN